MQNQSSANHAPDAVWAPLEAWNNVGIAGDSTGQYLGNGWIITANHVGRPDATHIHFQLAIGGTTYAWTGTGARLGTHDLFLARLDPDGSGNLPDAYGATGLSLATATPAIGASVSLIGYGRNTGALDYYTVAGSAWTPTASDDPGAVGVHFWGAAATKTWGTNRIWGTTAAGSTLFQGPIANFTLARDAALAIDFSHSQNGGLSASADAATPFEAGAALNDSGGAVLIEIDGTYHLAGLIDTINRRPWQPGSSTTVGNSTFAIDLTAYAAEIQAIIVPEPSAALLLSFGALVVAGRRRRGSR